jgi:hypothetical protein
MCINAILPYVALFQGWAVPWIFRKIDMKFGNDRYVTKQKSMSKYKNLWSGGDYIMHIKNSAILLVVFVTCLYGIGMPILFPVAAINFFNQGVCERIMACYQVKLPPLLDDTMINNLFSTLKWAPLMMLLNGYWMLTNEQIFNNKWTYKPNSDSDTHMASDHFINLNINQACPMLIMSLSAVFMTLFIALCPHSLRMALGFSS